MDYGRAEAKRKSFEIGILIMKNENKSAANVRQIRDTSATKKAKTRKVSPTKTPNANKSAAELQQIRYAFAPILQQFRSHTRKNEARLWLPVETNLIFVTNFAHFRRIRATYLLRFCFTARRVERTKSP